MEKRRSGQERLEKHIFAADDIGETVIREDLESDEQEGTQQNFVPTDVGEEAGMLAALHFT